MPFSPPTIHVDESFDLREVVGDAGVADAMSAFSRLRAEHARLLEVLAAPYGVTATDIRALFFLAANGEVIPKEAAEFLGLTTGAVTSLVDRNERAGLVRRVAHPRDRRSLILELTPLGHEAVATWSAHYREAFSAAIPADRLEEVTAAFARLAAEMREHTAAASGERA